jgi:crossover junction endodeoxyribonuclease RuvC
MTVLSVDVGIRACGYCICEIRNIDIKVLKEGEIKPHQNLSLTQKLNYIFEGLKKEMMAYKIKAIVVEALYSHYRHPTTLGVLAQVRGVIALLAYKTGVDFLEYSTTRARKSLLGRGNVNSEQVKKMAESVMNRKFLSIHTADAFSLAVAFSHAQKLKDLRIGYSYDFKN